MIHSDHILVTGANGFIGSALTRELLSRGFRVRMTGQLRPSHLEKLGAVWFEMRDLNTGPDWQPALDGITGVVHLAGIAHRVNKDQASSPSEYDVVNHLATRSLAKAISQTPTIGRFLFASSVAVYGDAPTFPLIVAPNIDLAPSTHYGMSKLNAERAIQEHLSESHCRWAILRPVLIYGPGNPGNMARLIQLVKLGMPLPVSRIPNRRSLLYIGNLLSAITAYLLCPSAPAGKTWLISDGEDLSTEGLIHEIGHAASIRTHTIKVPFPLLRSIGVTGTLLNRIGLPAPWDTITLNKLLGDFFVDATSIQRDLIWHPPYTPHEGISHTFKS